MKKHTRTLAGFSLFFLAASLNVSFAQDPIKFENLFDGKTLDGWQQIQGTAKYEVIDGMIVGTTVKGSPNSFLVTKKLYGDFVLELDFKVDEGLNSGIQFRSTTDKNYKDGIVHGYQVEIDPAQKELYSKDPKNYKDNGEVVAPGTEPRSWTGGIYDEKRRGWLNDLTHNEAARKAFKPGEWNHFRIEATGYRMYTWINGVLASALFDDMTPSGFIGLQVHATNAPKPMKVYWKNIVIQDLANNSAALDKTNQDLTKKQTNSAVKTSLNAFSFAKKLNSNEMSLTDLIDYAATHGFDAVDLTGYYFPDYPAIPSDEYINNLKRHAFKMGIDISGTGVRNNFADPDPAKRAADVKHVKEWIDVAVKLGAPVVRVFAGPIPAGYENKWDEICTYMAASLKECADYGKLKGVLVGVQNHGDFLKTADETIKLIKMVNSDWLGAIVDVGYFITPDPYLDIEKIMPYAVNYQVKESPFGVLSRVRTDMPRLLRIISNSGYRGYLPIETLGDKVLKGQPKPAFPFRPYDADQMVPALLKELKTAIANEYKASK
ncbi:MAG TPA: family 16 glycoside hydrolase [Bacteroidales bacterium]|nr:family 16 glycoside hydrolase [Bacteroidales bacterium]